MPVERRALCVTTAHFIFARRSYPQHPTAQSEAHIQKRAVFLLALFRAVLSV
jgi:hypothetical protein